MSGASLRLAGAAVATLAALACGDTGASDRPAGRGAAYTKLYQALGRPAGLRVLGDTGVVVTVMERRGSSRREREVAARVTARTVAREWNTGRLTRVTTVFREATRLGPFILRTRDDSLAVADSGVVAAPAASP